MSSSGNKKLDQRSLEILRAFGSPVSLIWDYLPDSRLAHSSAHRNNVVYIGGEFGGGASVNPDGVKLTYDGTVRALVAMSAAVFVGGDFTRINNVERKFIARVDATTGALAGWNANANGTVVEKTRLAAQPNVHADRELIGPRPVIERSVSPSGSVELCVKVTLSGLISGNTFCSTRPML